MPAFPSITHKIPRKSPSITHKIPSITHKIPLQLIKNQLVTEP